MRVMVTGCSSGIGLVTALHLGRQGNQVVAGVRNPDRCDALANAIDDEGLPITIVELDVNEPSSVSIATSTMYESLGGIDALVNNAGVSQLTAIEDLSDDDALALINTNYLGTLRMCRAVVPIMRGQRSGRIVNVSSMNAQAAFAYTGGYAASKAAMEAMSEALALETSDTGIAVTIIQPGVFDTDIDVKSLPSSPSPHHADAIESMSANRSTVAAGAPPSAVAAAIADVLDASAAPLRVPVGRDAVGILRRRHEMGDSEFFTWVRSLGA